MASQTKKLQIKRVIKISEQYKTVTILHAFEKCNQKYFYQERHI